MNDPHWTDYVAAISAAATPVLVAVLSGVGLYYRQILERRWKAIEQRWKKEEQLQPDRIEAYDTVLDPFIVLLMSDKAWMPAQRRKEFKNRSRVDVALATILSLDYRRNSFKLMLIGGDEVIRAYNDLMQYFYNRGDEPMDEAETVRAMGLFGRLILEIRRSVGNEATQLQEWDMLEWFMSDARDLQAKYRV